eukprot:854413_1
MHLFCKHFTSNIRKHSDVCTALETNTSVTLPRVIGINVGWIASDYLYIMDYDANTQIWDSQCIARANAPYEITQRGVQSYLNLGIDPSKLILGVPWYGKQ